MGRTKRKRARRSGQSVNLENDPRIINLKRSLSFKHWKNETKLQLRAFQKTGRGLTSLRNINSGDILIEVPLELLITYKTLEKYMKNVLIVKLKMQELLALFLILIKHKPNSPWKFYVDSMPSEIPPLPFFYPDTDLCKLPLDLQLKIKCRKSEFEESWRRVKDSIDTKLLCDCCSSCIQSLICKKDFIWAYAMVNTRAVYISPYFSFSADILLDQPSMALCPFLDMFNHSERTETKAEISSDKNFYRLQTSSNWKKHEEVFISYGAHNNLTLLCEYGFFIPNFELDSVNFTFQDVIKECPDLNKVQFEFIKKFSCDLFINMQGLSFNLKALLCTALSVDKNWSVAIYTGEFNDKLLTQMKNIVKLLLSKEIAAYKVSINQNTPKELILSYLKYKLDFMETLYKDVEVITLK